MATDMCPVDSKTIDLILNSMSIIDDKDKPELVFYVVTKIVDKIYTFYLCGNSKETKFKDKSAKHFTPKLYSCKHHAESAIRQFICTTNRTEEQIQKDRDKYKIIPVTLKEI